MKPEPEPYFQMDISVRKELRGGTVGADGDHNRYLVAYMLVYEKGTSKEVNLSGTADC